MSRSSEVYCISNRVNGVECDTSNFSTVVFCSVVEFTATVWELHAFEELTDQHDRPNVEPCLGRRLEQHANKSSFIKLPFPNV